MAMAADRSLRRVLQVLTDSQNKQHRRSTRWYWVVQNNLSGREEQGAGLRRYTQPNTDRFSHGSQSITAIAASSSASSD